MIRWRVSGTLKSWKEEFCTIVPVFWLGLWNGSGRRGLGGGCFPALRVEQHDGAARGLDLLDGGLGELLCAHRQLLLELAVAEHLEERRDAAGETARENAVEVHRRAVV